MNNKNILIGITGGIAAYKSAELVRKLRATDANIKIIMTDAAKKFITPLTLQSLSANLVYDDMFAKLDEFAIEHIELAKWADLILVAPATANFIARLANGFANDLLSTVCLATKAPIAVAPAMNVNMWLNHATQINVAKIMERGVQVFGPTDGLLACGDQAIGKMLEPQELIELVATLFPKIDMVGKKILITAGPTREPIDPVRYISNKSSGKMGYALAAAAVAAGAEVVLVSGPTNIPTPNVTKLIKVLTAEEMLSAVMNEVNNCEIFIAVAAVADFMPKYVKVNKIKKEFENEDFNLKLKKSSDILAAVTKLPNSPFIVAFAAETENLIVNAKTKLKNKNVDMLIANQVGENIGFDDDFNSVVVLAKDLEPIILPKMRKIDLATKILEQIIKRFEAANIEYS